jgi:hypothetical protein
MRVTSVCARTPYSTHQRARGSVNRAAARTLTGGGEVPEAGIRHANGVRHGRWPELHRRGEHHRRGTTLAKHHWPTIDVVVVVVRRSPLRSR